MPFLSTTRRRLAATVSVLAVAGTGAVFVLTSGALASASPTPTAAKASVSAKPAKAVKKCQAKATHRRCGLLARTDYATFEVRRKGHWVTLDLNRGKVTAVSSTRITLKRPDGATVTIALDPTTKYVGVSGESAVRTGHHASVYSTDGAALRVSQITKAS